MVEWAANSDDSYSDTTMFNAYYEEWTSGDSNLCSGFPAMSYYSTPLSSGQPMSVDSDDYYSYDTTYYYDYTVYECTTTNYADYGFSTYEDCYYYNSYATWYNDYSDYYYDGYYNEYYYCAFNVIFEYTSGTNSTDSSVIAATNQWVTVYTNSALATAASAIAAVGATALFL